VSSARPDLAGWEPDPEMLLPDHYVHPGWPWWHAWMGVAGLWYARRPRSSPPKVVRARSLAGLAGKIAEATATR
jgi:hypothetical protein